MPAYVMYNQIEVTDPDAMHEYHSKIGAVMGGFGARVIALDSDPNVLEGEWRSTRNVILEFPDLEAVERWYGSEEYRPLLELRLRAARGNLIVLKGA